MTHYFEVTVRHTQKVLVAIDNDDYDKACEYAKTIAIDGTQVSTTMTCVIPLADDLPDDIKVGDVIESEFPVEVLAVIDYAGYIPEEIPAINPEKMPGYGTVDI